MLCCLSLSCVARLLGAWSLIIFYTTCARWHLWQIVQTDNRDGTIYFYILYTISSLRELLARFIALQVCIQEGRNRFRTSLSMPNCHGIHSHCHPVTVILVIALLSIIVSLIHLSTSILFQYIGIRLQSYSHTVILSYCHTVILSYCHTVISTF